MYNCSTHSKAMCFVLLSTPQMEQIVTYYYNSKICMAVKTNIITIIFHTFWVSLHLSLCTQWPSFSGGSHRFRHILSRWCHYHLTMNYLVFHFLSFVVSLLPHFINERFFIWGFKHLSSYLLNQNLRRYSDCLQMEIHDANKGIPITS